MTRKQKRNKIQEALEEGKVGATLGSLITGKSERAVASMLLGAAIDASVKALEEAMELGIPVMYEEGGVIYKAMPNGEQKKVKTLKKNTVEVPSTFKLEKAS